MKKFILNKIISLFYVCTLTVVGLFLSYSVNTYIFNVETTTSTLRWPTLLTFLYFFLAGTLYSKTRYKLRETINQILLKTRDFFSVQKRIENYLIQSISLNDIGEEFLKEIQIGYDLKKASLVLIYSTAKKDTQDPTNLYVSINEPHTIKFTKIFESILKHKPPKQQTEITPKDYPKLHKLGYRNIFTLETQDIIIGYIIISGTPHPKSAEYELLKSINSISKLYGQTFERIKPFEDIKKAYTKQKKRISEIEREYKIAREIQNGLLPATAPNFPGLSIEPLLKSAKEVSGDFYDYYPLTKTKCGVVIADLVGKGIPAAMMMMNLKRVLDISITNNHSVSETMQQINKNVYQDPSIPKFVPLFYGILDTYNHTFTYTNSIGNAGGILLSNNTFKELDKGGFAIGGTEDTDYEEETIPLQKDDNIILFTDGIVEQRNTANKQFGQKRLTDILLKNKNNKNILTNIQTEIESYMHNWQQEDDITMINIACTA